MDPLRTTLIVLLLASVSIADAQELDGPVITRPSENEIILQSGQNYTFICKANRAIEFKQQEISEEMTEGFYMETRYEKTENGSEYTVALDLYNVDHFAVGYYACFDDTIKGPDILSHIVQEPENTAHVSYIYVYVNGSTLFAPMRAIVDAITGEKFLVECRPTTPDIKVDLLSLDEADVDYDQFSPKIGFTVDSDILSDPMTNILTCGFEKQNSVVYLIVGVHKLGD